MKPVHIILVRNCTFQAGSFYNGMDVFAFKLGLTLKAGAWGKLLVPTLEEKERRAVLLAWFKIVRVLDDNIVKKDDAFQKFLFLCAKDLCSDVQKSLEF